MFTSNGALNFAPLIPKTFNNTATVTGKRIGTLTLDIVTSEQHDSVLRITDNPVASGSKIADHAALEPKSISITGFVVDYDPHSSKAFSSPGFNLRSGADFLNNLIPPSFKTVTSAAISRIERELTSFITNSEVAPVRAIAPWLTEATSGATDNSSSGDRIQRIYDDFLKLQKSGEVIEIQTGMRLYTNMLIEMISVNQTQGSSAEFTINAREVHIVDTKLIGGVFVSSGNKSGRAGAQGADMSQKGQTQPVEEKEESLLGVVFGGR